MEGLLPKWIFEWLIVTDILLGLTWADITRIDLRSLAQIRCYSDVFPGTVAAAISRCGWIQMATWIKGSTRIEGLSSMKIAVYSCKPALNHEGNLYTFFLGSQKISGDFLGRARDTSRCSKGTMDWWGRRGDRKCGGCKMRSAAMRTG